MNEPSESPEDFFCRGGSGTTPDSLQDLFGGHYKQAVRVTRVLVPRADRDPAQRHALGSRPGCPCFLVSTYSLHLVNPQGALLPGDFGKRLVPSMSLIATRSLQLRWLSPDTMIKNSPPLVYVHVSALRPRPVRVTRAPV